MKENVDDFVKYFQPCPPAVPATVSIPVPVMPQSIAQTSGPVCPSRLPGCPLRNALLENFCCHVEALPPSVGIADENHPLAAFAGDPTGCVGIDEDAWEKFDGPLNTILQKPPEELQSLVWVGE